MFYLHKNIICKDGLDNNLVKTNFIGLKEKVLANKSEMKNTEIQKRNLLDQLEVKDKKIDKTSNEKKDLNETVLDYKKDSKLFLFLSMNTYS